MKRKQPKTPKVGVTKQHVWVREGREPHVGREARKGFKSRGGAVAVMNRWRKNLTVWVYRIRKYIRADK